MTAAAAHRADAGQISRMLAGRITSLAPELLPAGKRDGAEWRCGSVAGEPGQSCAVHLGGAKAGVWGDFSTGEAGDALDLVAAVLYRGDRVPAIKWARRWLGLGGEAAPATRRAYLPPANAAPPAPDADAEQRRRAAVACWLQAPPSLAGTPAADYLRARGIDLARLGRQPRALRCHPRLWNVESREHWPALVAAVCDASGAHVATHRTWLARRGGAWGKAPLRDPKRSLGRIGGGTIRLWRGASGKALADAPAGEAVVIGEGIETCLSIALACPELRVLAGVSLGNMGAIHLPAAIGTVILAADNDGDNAQARSGLQRAINHFLADGRQVRVARPAVGKDFNDTLQGWD